MAAVTVGTVGRSVRCERCSRLLFRTDPSVLGTDVAVVPVRIALVWIFTYYGAGKLFGWFNGPGIHRTAIFFSTTAHLHPGGLFAVARRSDRVRRRGGARSRVCCRRLAALPLFGDKVMAMITVSWAHGINSLSATPGYEFNLALAAMALVVVGLGAGRWSVDAAIAWRLALTRPSVAHAVDGQHSAVTSDRLRHRADPLPR